MKGDCLQVFAKSRPDDHTERAGVKKNRRKAFPGKKITLLQSLLFRATNCFFRVFAWLQHATTVATRNMHD